MNKCPRCDKENPAEIHTCSPQFDRVSYLLGFADGQARKWIKFADEKPPNDGRYLVSESAPVTWIGVATMYKGQFDISITHWMPLPEKPE